MLISPPAHLPERLIRLWELAHNLWWSWHPAASAVFRALDVQLWRRVGYNPVALLRTIDPERLDEAVTNPAYLRRLNDILARFDDDIEGPGRRAPFTGDLSPDYPVAYFCAEFGLHSSVPMYSGGLGVLAGDHCREASDLHVPMVAVGLLYQKGYFHQRLRADGTQEAIAETFDPELMPLKWIDPGNGDEHLAAVRLEDRLVHVGAWRIDLGCVPIYLLDTDVNGNNDEDRELTAQLYSGDDRMRVRQEMILGIGGVRVLRALGITPSFWHLNEGHTAFLSLERLREKTAGGIPFDDALAQLRRNALFTTHTPVAAGHDRFSRDLVSQALGYFMDAADIDAEQIFALAAEPHNGFGMFSMAAFALRTTGWCNGVSRRHGEVARRMWQPLWPDRSEAAVPIDHITNGIHVPNWITPPMLHLFDRHLGAGWMDRQHESTLWDLVIDIPSDELWQAHLERKLRLQLILRERIRRSWVDGELKTVQVVSAGLLLDPEVLTIGFARRFATYKRANLIFRDMERLRRILLNEDHPVQIIFAGKAHPRDEHGQDLIKQVYRLALDPSLAGRIAFVEDYDLDLARYLVSGVDVWMNTPLPPMEASGTSGQKAALNGIPHFSTLDGWWLEAYRGANGWAIGPEPTLDEFAGEHPEDIEARNIADAEALYSTLETDIVPLYYDRNGQGVPESWLEVMKQAIRTAGCEFSARRMMLEYVERYYGPASTA